MKRQTRYYEAKQIFPEVTPDEWAAAVQTSMKFGKTYTKEAGDFYVETLGRLTRERKERENPE